jgi:hypothetical protein
MTIDELTEKTKNLEEELQYRIEDFEGLNRPARVTEVRVLEPYHDREDETSRNQEVEVRLNSHPQGLPQKEKKTLERRLRKLLREYERGTGCRVTEVLVRQERGYEVEVRVDLLAYPQRLLKKTRKTLEVEFEGLLHDFASRTQGRIAEIQVTEVGPESYSVQVRLAPGCPQ